MKKVEIFFDYNCPYCLKGHLQLLEFLPQNPGLEVIWHPCEISVYKKEAGNREPDLCLQGMYFAADNNIDLWRYHKKVYDLIFTDRVNTKDIDSLVNAFENFLDVEALRQALKNGKYVNNVKEANHFAFEVTGVHVVPTYRADGGVLQDRQEFYGMGPSDTSYGNAK